MGVAVAIVFDGLVAIGLMAGVGLGLGFVVELHPATNTDKSILLATINIRIYFFIISHTNRHILMDFI
ncbi:MAG TPA: hypothetical protein VEG44_07210 [Candidatus Acidoferrales bacterium]|nr:hypothetical protein [Candidatus Acidoferrales bacterium]